MTTDHPVTGCGNPLVPSTWMRYRRQSDQLDDVLHRLHHIERKLNALLYAQGVLMADLSALDASVAQIEADVAADTALDSSAATLLDRIAVLLQENATDPAAIAALADRLSSASASGASSNAALTAALTRNTPAETTPPAEPPVEPVPPAEPPMEM